MAVYQTETATITTNWASVIGNLLVDAPGSQTSTSFYISDTDGNETQVTGSGFTYNANGTAVTGGTITGLHRIIGGVEGEYIFSFSLSATTFWAAAGSQKIADVLGGDDTFIVEQNQLNHANGIYALDGYSGTNTLSEAGLTSDTLVFVIDSVTHATLRDIANNTSVQLSNFRGFTGGSGATFFTFTAQPAFTMTETGGAGGAQGFGVVEMGYALSDGASATLDLTAQNLVNIEVLNYTNTLSSGTASGLVKLNSSQFGGTGVSSSLIVERGASPPTSLLEIVMNTASFDASALIIDPSFLQNGGYVMIDGHASSTNLTIVGVNAPETITGGSGSDSITGGSDQDQFYGSAGNDTINGGVGAPDYIYYSQLTTSGMVANVHSGTGTVNKGGANGIDHLTNIYHLTGSTGSDVFYLDKNETVSGNGGFDYLIELSPNVNFYYSNQLTGISEFVSNTGSNTVDFSLDSNVAYLYGSTGNDTLSLGLGGGYLFGEGGTNTLNGGFGGVNIFEGGSGGTNTMNGATGSATNYYYVGSSDQVHGAGAFNAVIELVAGVTVQLGSTQYQDVQEFVANSGTNTVTVISGDSDFIYLYGAAGNDTLTTGSGGGYLIGEGGTNNLTGGGGLNVFVADNAAGVDTMNGGSGSNVYYIDSHSIVHGHGTFNTVVELQQNASLTLGSASLTGVQEVVFNGGTNLADFHSATTQVFLYGGSGNDTLFGGSGNDFLYGGLGTNTFVFGTGGKDTIEDWTAGTNDIIDLTALGIAGVHTVSDLTQTISGGKDVITLHNVPATNSITLLGVGSALTASSFHFS